MTRPRGSPQGDVETGVITVRLPKAMIAHLDGYIARLASQTGGQTNRNTVVRQMLERSLSARPEFSLPVPFPEGKHETTAEPQRQTLGQQTHELARRSQALRMRSQKLCQRLPRLYTKSNALSTRSKQLQHATQALRAMWQQDASPTTACGSKR